MSRKDKKKGRDDKVRGDDLKKTAATSAMIIGKEFCVVIHAIKPGQ